MNQISSQEIFLLLPLLILTAGSLILLLLEVFLKSPWPRSLLAVGTLVGAAFGVAAISEAVAPGQRILFGLIYADPFSLFFTGLLIAVSLFVVVPGSGFLRKEGIETPGEYYSLLLMSTAGAIIFVSAAELITLFLGLEIMSMALYCLCGSAYAHRRSAESAMKYFFLGSFSSAFLLYGMALLYGMTGTTELAAIASVLANGAAGPVAIIGMALLLVGFIFKVGAVPFHFWTPDVYQGAPTPVTLFMASTVKVASFGAALRVIWTALRVTELIPIWTVAIWYIALFTMVLGNLVALRQRSLKRMLAFSSVAHAGYMLVAFLALEPQFGGGAALLYYLVVYSVMTIGAFGIVMVVASHQLDSDEADDITTFNSLGSRSPTLAALMTIFMLGMAGLPPAMAGLLGKFYVFHAAVKAGFVGLAIAGVLCSAASCYYYLRVVVAMYFLPDESNEGPLAIGYAMGSALNICALLVVVLGTFPGAVYDATARVMLGLIG